MHEFKDFQIKSRFNDMQINSRKDVKKPKCNKIYLNLNTILVP